MIVKRILSVCGVFALSAAASFANIYDATADFPHITGGPQLPVSLNGVWSYGYETTLGPASFTPYTASTTDYFNDGGTAAGFYTTSGGYNLPTVLQNVTGTTLNNEGGSIGPWPTDVLLMHPGPGPTSESSVIQFTAPSTATYVITGTFYAIGGGPGVTTDSVIGPGGGAPLFSTTSTSATNTFSFDEHLAQGQSIDFVVGLGPAPGNQFFNDSTAFDANISPTPEPAFFGVLGLGLTGLAAALHRRKKAERA